MPEQVSIWIMQNGGAEWIKKFQIAAANYELHHPDKTVSVRFIPWLGAMTHIIEAYKRGKLPDVIQIGTTWLASFAHFGLIQPIPFPIDPPRCMDEIGVKQRLIDECKVGDEVYAIPWFGDTRLLYVNTALAEQNDLNDLLDYRSFLKCSSILRRNGLDLLSMSCEGTDMFLQNMGPWIWAHGGQYIDLETGEFGLAPGTPGFEGFMEFLRYVQLSGLSSYREKGSQGLVFSRFFLEQASCFAIHSCSSRTTLDPFKTLPMPKMGGFHHQFLGGSHLAVTRQSPHPKAAAELAIWMASETIDYAVLSNTNTCLQLPLDGFTSRFPQSIHPNEIVPYLRFHTIPKHPLWPAVEPIIAEEISQITHEVNVGKSTPSEAKNRLVALDQHIRPVLIRRR